MDTTHLPWIFESDLAEKIGVQRAVLTEARLVLELGDQEWTRKRGGVAYFHAGVVKVCAHLHLEEPADLGPAEEPEKDNGLLAVIVVRAARLNSRMIFAAEKKDDAPEIPVRVRKAELFVPGQEIHVRMEGGLAHLHGPQPRQRGRQPRRR